MNPIKRFGSGIAKDYIQYKFERSNVPLGDGQYIPTGLAAKGVKGLYHSANNMTGGKLDNVAGPAIQRVKSGLQSAGFNPKGSVIGRVMGNPLTRAAVNVASGRIGRIGAAARSGRTLIERNKVTDMTKMANVRKAYEEMKELEKEAELNLKDSIKHHAANVGVGLAMTAAAHAGSKLYNKVTTERVWKKVIERNPELDTPDAREHFEVLQQFSPAVASNPTTARSYLQRTMHTGMMPHEFVKDLVNLQDIKDKGGFGATAKDVAKNTRFGESMRAVSESKRHEADSAYRKEKDEREFGYKKERDSQEDARKDKEFNYRKDRDSSEDWRKAYEFDYKKQTDDDRSRLNERKDARDEADFNFRQKERQKRPGDLSALKRDIDRMYSSGKGSVDPASDRWIRVREKLLSSGVK